MFFNAGGSGCCIASTASDWECFFRKVNRILLNGREQSPIVKLRFSCARYQLDQSVALCKDVCEYITSGSEKAD